MANETLVANQTALVATELLARDSIRANLPKVVMTPQMHHDSLDGAGTLTKRYMVESDLGIATGGTEGVDLTLNTVIGMGTSVNGTPTEGVAMKATISDKTVRRRLGGTPFRTVRDVFTRGSLEQMMALLAPDVRRFAAMAFQKFESDALALLTTITASAGLTNTVLSFTTMLTSLFTQKTNQPLTEDWAFLLAPIGIHHLSLEALATSGGLGGSLWMAQADASLTNNPADLSKNGMRGSFLQRPVHEYGHSLRPFANGTTDVVGALFCKANPGQAPDDPSLAGMCGAFNSLEGHPLDFQTQADVSLRAAELVMTWEYIQLLQVDANATKIISRAT